LIQLRLTKNLNLFTKFKKGRIVRDVIMELSGGFLEVY
jgi:hypothetical protein